MAGLVEVEVAVVATLQLVMLQTQAEEQVFKAKPAVVVFDKE